MEKAIGFRCPKCSTAEFETGQIRVSGGLWSSLFNLENKRYSTVTCANCGYTEIYKGDVSGLAKIFDFLGG